MRQTRVRHVNTMKQHCSRGDQKESSAAQDVQAPVAPMASVSKVSFTADKDDGDELVM